MRLSDADFDSFPMLVVDLMHEFEQGVWKVFFIHLLCMLDSKGSSFIKELDMRYGIYSLAGAHINWSLKGFEKFPHLAGGRSGSFHPTPQR